MGSESLPHHHTLEEKLRPRQELQASATSLLLTEPNPVSVGDFCGSAEGARVSEMHLQSNSDTMNLCYESHETINLEPDFVAPPLPMYPLHGMLLEN